jgi:hypothetical protein
MSTLSNLAEQIYDVEFYWSDDLVDSRYSDPIQARSSELVIIQSWLDAHIGELNILINTSFTPDQNGDIAGFGQEESSILREIYMFNYYRKQSRNTLRSLDGTTGVIDSDFRTIREGDSVITKNSGSRQDLARFYRLLMIQAQENIDKLVHAYNMYSAKPNQVSGGDAPA